MARTQDFGQPGTRRAGIVTDQHGRKWSCSIDKKSGYPVSMIQPMGWHAPWLPPQGPDTFKFDPNEPSRFTINYEGLLQERMEAVAEYDKDREMKAASRGWDPDDVEKQDALDKLCGRRGTLQRPEVVVACMQGDKWVLGLTSVVNEKVAKFIPKKVNRREAMLSKFPDFTVDEELEAHMDWEEQHDPLSPQDGREPKPRGTYTEFVKDHRRQGRDMAEIGVLWKEHKKSAA